ncbi:hypothetical protein PybrP1_012173 [[Pythium] brassicae (nom. inval.)]|nr:hypothetical protein PybrP1_012173 [[Pythium] brassicae (nom. inval.)]
MSSSLDDFDFVHYSSAPRRDQFLSEARIPQDALRPVNIRFPGRKRPMAASDPCWNWFKMGQLKEQSRLQSSARATSHTSALGELEPSRHAIHAQRSHKRKLQAQLIGQVQSARLQLRDKRSHNARAASGAGIATVRARGDGSGYDPPSQRALEAFDRHEMAPQGANQLRPEKSSRTPLSSSADTYAPAPRKPSAKTGDAWTSATAPAATPQGAAPPSSETRLKWADMFEILSDTIGDDELPGLTPSARQFLMTCGLAECSCGRHAAARSDADALADDEWDDADDADDTPTRVRGLAACLRQSLTALRVQESEFMKSLSGSGGGGASVDADTPYASLHDWTALVASAAHYHDLLARFVRCAVRCVREGLQLRPLAAIELVRAVVAEVSSTIGQLPDCEALFESCRAYVFFFEVADRSAKSTPLLTAITRTYWYNIQVLLALKALGVGTDGVVALAPDLVRAAQDAAESVLPTNRAILAASLFLVDLYLYLPSAYRFEATALASDGDSSAAPQDTSESAMPAVSLWLLLYDCFSSGTCSFQAGKLSAAGDGRDFWAFLQAMYRDHFVDHLAVAFTQERSSGGYLVDGVPTISRAKTDEDDVAEGRLLALQCAWDLCILLSAAFLRGDARESDGAISDARWAMVKDLLQPRTRSFLPFETPAPAASNQEFASFASVFKLQVLQRVFALSKLSTPHSGTYNVVERLLEELWRSDDAQDDDPEPAELPPLWSAVMAAAEQGGRLQDVVLAWQADSSDRTDAVSAIIMLQMFKFDKAVHRNRFRQPICRAIAARFDATHGGHAGESLQVSAPAATRAPEKPSAWNWGSSGAKSDPKAVGRVEDAKKAEQSKALVARGRDEERLMVSVLLALAVPGICADAAPLSRESRDRPQGANKPLRRDLEFYCKELCRVAKGKDELALALGQALYLLVRATHALRAHRSLHFVKDAVPTPAVRRRSQRLQRAVVSALYAMRDLTRTLCAIIPSIPEATPPALPSYASEAVRSSVAFILNAGLEACLDAAMDQLVPVDALHASLEILQLLVPRRDDIPSQHLQVAAAMAPAPPMPTTASGEPVDEFGEFDALFEDDVWATVDLDAVSSAAGHGATPSSLKTFEDTAVRSLLAHLRLSLQRVVIKFPDHEPGPGAHYELYAVELLGALVATCSFPFGWSLVSGSALKPRVLAPRLLSAVLKHQREKDWFSTCFLSESGADQELASLWLMATLDLRALLPPSGDDDARHVPESDRFAFPLLAAGATVTQDAGAQTRYSDYWVMLTDTILFHVLRENAVAQYKTDPLLLRLLRATARNISFARVLQSSAATASSSQPPRDLATLYALHLDVFQEFCRSSGALWGELSADPAAYRAAMNRFRLKTMDVKSGVFTAFPEAYEINLKLVSQELDRAGRNWYALSEKFLRDFTTPAAAGGGAPTNFHAVDEALELAHGGERRGDAGVRRLIVLFKLMYGCVDAFLYHCGTMAIGQQNLFFAVMRLMFRQASCAEFPQAETRLRQLQQAAASQHADAHQSRWFDSSLEAGGGAGGGRQPQLATSAGKHVSPACLGFVESVRLFFARQKYPSLLHWFSQTLETYQTLQRGWSASPLRKLLLNVLDPHGPLGIHSYYPIDADLHSTSAGRGRHECEFDVRHVRREAFYLSCGLFLCRCTSAYEHSRLFSAAEPAAHDAAAARLRTLRVFILNDFIRETFAYAAGDPVCLLETLVPVAQFVRAVLSHCSLNLQQQPVTSADPPARSFDFAWGEVNGCLERLLRHCITTFDARAVLQTSIRCVLAVELCGIVSEAVALIDAVADSAASALLELGVAYFREIHAALSESSANALPPVFATSAPERDALPSTAELLAMFPSATPSDGLKTEPSIKDERTGANTSPLAADEYGISRVRVQADLVVSIARLAHRCSCSSDTRLRRFAAAATVSGQ